MKTKICHIATQITGRADGVFKHLEMLFSSLDRTRYDLILIFQGGKEVEKKADLAGIKYYILPELNKKISILCLYRIAKIISKERVEIIHSHSVKSYIAAGLVNVFLKQKHIFNFHGVFIDSEYYNAVEKAALWSIHSQIILFSGVNLAIAPSDSSKKYLNSQTQKFPDIISYYNGYMPVTGSDAIDAELQNVISSNKDKKIIAVIGRLEREKRIDLVLEVVSELRNESKDLLFLIVGEGSLESDIRAQIEKKQLSKIIILSKYERNIDSLFKHIYVVFNISEREGFPMTFWEAMGNGVPIVTSMVGGAAEIIEKEKCGLLFGSGDVTKAIVQLRLLLDNKQDREILGSNCRRAVDTKYNIESFIRKIDDIYQGVKSI